MFKSTVTLVASALAMTVYAAPMQEIVTESAPPTGKWFDHIIIFMFENHAEDEVIKDPNFSKYTKMGRGLEKYYAITHPSQPNYLTITSGDYYKENTDANVNLDKTNIVDLLEKKGLTWKGYMEDFPGKCNPAKSVGKYYRKHNPFMSYNNIRTDTKRCANIVDTPQLDLDLKSGKFPNYSMLSPNIDNDAHNTNITFGGKWLDAFMGPRLNKFPARTLIVVTWDEDDYTEENKVLTFLLDPNGNIFKAGTVDDTEYNHYSLLKTVEENWDLGDLGRNDVKAMPFNFQAEKQF